MDIPSEQPEGDDLEDVLSGAQIFDNTGFIQRFSQLKLLGFDAATVGRLSYLLKIQSDEKRGIGTMPEHLVQELNELRQRVRAKLEQQ